MNMFEEGNSTTAVQGSLGISIPPEPLSPKAGNFEGVGVGGAFHTHIQPPASLTHPNTPTSNAEKHRRAPFVPKGVPVFVVEEFSQYLPLHIRAGHPHHRL